MNPPNESLQILTRVTTASIASVLLKQGLRKVWMRGPRPVRSGLPRVAGPAFTLRFLPLREDLAAAGHPLALPTTRHAIEAAPAGSVLVADALGCTEAGAFGDVLTARMRQRGVQALVVDGAIRDLAGVLDVGLPVWCTGTAAPAPQVALSFLGWQQPVACGGVAVFPGDTVVADDDGAVVVPQALLDDTARQAAELEALDAWVLDEVARGAVLPGLYPPNAENLARYQQARTAQPGHTGEASA